MRRTKNQFRISRIRTKRRKKKLKRKKLRPHFKRRRKKSSIVRVVGPSDFSLLTSPIEMIHFIKNIEDNVRSGGRVFIDLNEVDSILPDGILYLLNRLSALRIHDSYSQIFGNAPTKKGALEIFRASGFYDYVRSGIGTSRKKGVMSIMHGTRVDSSVIGQIIEFVIANTSYDRVSLRRIYDSSVEIITNTRQHADPSFEKSWWIMALIDNTTGVIRFACLDTGQGIPATMRRTFAEKAIGHKSDADLLESAFNGEFRSSTLKKHRGRGLPQVLSSFNEGVVTCLGVISKRGYICYRNGDEVVKKTLEHEFRGTLITWDLPIAGKNG